MHEYIRRLCAAGMRVDHAYEIVDNFYRELDFEGLRDFVAGYETAARIVRENVD